MRILLVEDEPRIAADVRAALEAAGYLVEVAGDGEDAWFRGDTEDYDLIVLDLGLPKMDGLAVLKSWRAAGRLTPVLVLTARGTWAERVEGIDAGADDYLPKPFRMEELVARARALIRRAAGHGTVTIEAGPLSVDTRQMRVSRGGVPQALSPLEYRLVAYLAHHKGRVVATGELLEHLYGDDDARDANALEAVVARLRKKLGAETIETRRGFGYMIDDAPDEAAPDEAAPDEAAPDEAG
jgi:two-component system OmpR family response regulator